MLHAVDNVSLHIEEQEVVGLVGESGSGKSTYGKTLVGLHDKTAGEVIYKGETLPSVYKPGDFQRFAKSIQMIFQDPYSSLNPRMTVGEIVGEGLGLHSELSSEQIKDAVAEWLVNVGLEPDHMSRYPHEFSGGQRQRIAIARALAPEPKLVPADEPVSALDVSIQSQILNLLLQLRDDLDLTMVFISHDLSVVRYLADNIAVMNDGKIVEYGPADEVFDNPHDDYTRKLLAAIPEIQLSA